MALRSTQPVTEMSTRNLSGGKGRLARKADNLTAICEPTVWTSHNTRVFTACYRDSFTLPYSTRCAVTTVRTSDLAGLSEDTGRMRCNARPNK
jgi:hypothetical protein